MDDNKKRMNPSPHVMTALPKIYKRDIPIRSMFNFISVPGYKIYKTIRNSHKPIEHLRHADMTENST